MTLVRALKPVLFLSMGLGLVGILVGGPCGLQAEDPPQQGQAAQAGSVSNADCAVCHEEVVKAFDRNPHAVLEKSPKFNLKNSCESCHGPGQAHVEGGGDKTKIITFKEDVARGVYNRQCIACHKDSRQINGFSASMHGKQGLSCSECHGVHKSALTTQLLKQPANDLCFGCHIQTRADFARPYHHRVPERAMRCTDCHQPHGGLDRAMRRVSLNGSEPCFRCHREKEGPFVFEHAGLTIKDCMPCHQPHGSNNPKMLVRSTVRQLCLECHSTSRNVLTAQPPSFHDIRSPRYQNCTTCHVTIHGSNASPVFFR